MEEKIVTRSFFKNFTKVMAFVDEVEKLYNERDIPYEVEISYRILFDDYVVSFIV